MITEEFEKWYLETYGPLGTTKADIEEIRNKSSAAHRAPSITDDYLEAWMVNYAEKMRAEAREEKKRRRRRIMRVCGASLVALIVWTVAYYLAAFVIALIGRIPILSLVIYYPVGASWALISLPGPLAVGLGGSCSHAMVGTSKPFAVLVSISEIVLVGYALLTGAPVIRTVLEGIFTIATAALVFFTMDDS